MHLAFTFVGDLLGKNRLKDLSLLHRCYRIDYSTGCLKKNEEMFCTKVLGLLRD